MSYSALYVINKDLKPEYTVEYQNSWVFTPPIFSYLLNKYATPEEKENCWQKYWKYSDDKEKFREKPFYVLNVFQMGGQWNRINERINKSSILSDRIGWELCHQQLFESKSKDIISAAVVQLLADTDGDAERFKEISQDIRKIDEEKTPYFMFKNNSIDDGVEKFFHTYVEELDDTVNISLRDTEEKLDFDVVHITDEQKMYFTNPYDEFGIKRKVNE